MKTVIIGNKPYQNLDMSPVIDSVDENVRCNMTTVGRNNGTKYGSLALCNHLFRYLVNEPQSEDDFWKLYQHAYKEEEVRTFHRNYDGSKFTSVFYASPSSALNSYLASVGCPHRFTKQPRTGYVTMIQEAIKGKKVYVTQFTVDPTETRETYYVQSHHFESATHSKNDEMKVIKWLHENGHVDASMCLLLDEETPTFDCSHMKPTKEVVEMFREHFGDCNLQGIDEEHNTTKA
ncbi:MAG: hypothetical protein P8J32_06135 [bacterium]|nr:hypothetical protein [bacterium]